MPRCPRRSRSTSSSAASPGYACVVVVAERATSAERGLSEPLCRHGPDASLLSSELLGDRHQVRPQEADATGAARAVRAEEARPGGHQSSPHSTRSRPSSLGASPPPRRPLRPPSHRPGTARGGDAGHRGSAVPALRRRCALGRRGRAAVGGARIGSTGERGRTVLFRLPEAPVNVSAAQEREVDAGPSSPSGAKGKVRPQPQWAKTLSGLHPAWRSLE